MVRASDEFIKSRRYAEELVKRWSESRRRYETKPVHPVTARVNFQRAFAYRIGKRLSEAKIAAYVQAVQAERLTAGVAIALRDKEIEISDLYRLKSLARGHWHGSWRVRRLLRARQQGRRPRRPHRPPRRRGRDRRFPHEHLAMTLDDQRSRVYAAEDLAAGSDRSAEHPVLQVAGFEDHPAVSSDVSGMSQRCSATPTRCSTWTGCTSAGNGRTTG